MLTRLADPAQQAAAAAYAEWITSSEMEGGAPLAGGTSGPLISIVVPAFNTPDRYLLPMVQSVLAQTYEGWEMCLVDASTDRERSRAIARQAARDSRIRRIALGENRGISANTNAGLEAAGGDYIAFLDHDDTLAPWALNEVSAVLARTPDVDLFYSDEDKLSDDGRRRTLPFFKPDWSPDLFLCVNYLAHFVVARSSLVRSLEGLREGFEGAQDYDLVLRMLGESPRIHHVPRVSYHWRMAEGSTARSSAGKAGARPAGARALEESCERAGIEAAVDPIPPASTTYRLRYRLARPPDVHIAGTAFAAALRGTTEGVNIQELASSDALASLPPRDLVLLLEIAGTPDDPHWLLDLAGVASQPGAGLVAPGLHTTGGLSAGAGYIADGGQLWPLFAGQPLERWTPAGWPSWPRNAVALGGCAVLTVGVARALVPGAPLRILPLSMAAHRHGLRNVVWSHVGFSIPSPLGPIPLEEPLQDPFANPNLTMGTCLRARGQ